MTPFILLLLTQLYNPPLGPRTHSRNRRRYTWPWRILFLLVGFALGWAARGSIHL